MPGFEAQLPAHQIRSDQASIWLDRSVVTVTTFHATSSESARQIREQGVSVERSHGGAYGQGFYTATEVDPFFGQVVLTVAVRLEHPLIGTVSEVEATVDAIARRARPTDRGLTPLGSRAVRRELLRLGYDGLMIYDGGGDGIDYIIALEDATVKVVVDA